jgi:hypothetical protein
MRTLFYTFFLTGLFFTANAQADVLPEPAEEESSDEDTSADDGDSGDDGADEKSGCSSVGQLDFGVTLLPFLCIGMIAYSRRRKEQ